MPSYTVPAPPDRTSDIEPRLLARHAVLLEGRLDASTVSERLRGFDDGSLEGIIELTDNAALVNRLARIERGRRHENLRGKSLPPGSSHSQAEWNRRSEERAVAKWFKADAGALEYVETHGWHKLVAKARSFFKDQTREEKRIETRMLPADVRYRSFVSDIRDVASNIDSPVDVIVTDPPYPREYLWTFGELGRQAAKVLKPGGLCVVMSGQSYLPEVMDHLGEHLDYYWTAAYMLPGQPTPLRQRNVNCSWKPILVYANGQPNPRIFGDVMRSDRNEKDWHHWGQSISGMLDVVDRLTEPGDTILDPFIGGGATAVAALELDRSIVAADVDPEQIAASDARVTEWWHEQT